MTTIDAVSTMPAVRSGTRPSFAPLSGKTPNGGPGTRRGCRSRSERIVPSWPRSARLLTRRGRRERGAFAFEGPTLLHEALAAGIQPDEVYATQAAWDALGTEADRLTGAVYLVPERALARLSDVETPTGLVAVARQRLESPAALLADGATGPLAGRQSPTPATPGACCGPPRSSAIDRILFGADGVEPHNPKVVRASMGAIFRLRIGVTDPAAFAAAVRGGGHAVVAAGKGGAPVAEFPFTERTVLADRQRTAWDRHAGSRPPMRRSASHISVPARASTRPPPGAIVLYEFARRIGVSAVPVEDPRNPDLSRLGDAVTLCYNPFVFGPEPPD